MAAYYQFEVSLHDITPRIWRRFQLAASANFYDLHRAIQDSFGWESGHLWEFRVPGRRGRVLAGAPFDDAWGGEEIPDAMSAMLAQFFDVVPRPNTCEYLYDFGDSWAHNVRLTRRVESAGDFHRRLLAGKRACPPEDCGGAGGYLRFTEFHRTGVDPWGEDPEEIAEWLGDWDPSAFDPKVAKDRFDG